MLLILFKWNGECGKFSVLSIRTLILTWSFQHICGRDLHSLTEPWRCVYVPNTHKSVLPEIPLWLITICCWWCDHIWIINILSWQSGYLEPEWPLFFFLLLQNSQELASILPQEIMPSIAILSTLSLLFILVMVYFHIFVSAVNANTMICLQACSEC